MSVTPKGMTAVGIPVAPGQSLVAEVDANVVPPELQFQAHVEALADLYAPLRLTGCDIFDAGWQIGCAFRDDERARRHAVRMPMVYGGATPRDAVPRAYRCRAVRCRRCD